MKLQFTTILKGLGLSDDEIERIMNLSEEDLKAWKADPTIKAVRELMQNDLRNDSEFLNSIPEDKVPEATKKKIESGQYARFQNELQEVATKRLGLEDKVLTDDDKKSIKKMVEKIATSYLAKNNGAEGLQKLQADLQKAQLDHEESETRWADKLKTKETELSTQFSGKAMKALTKAALATLDKVKLSVPPAYVTDTVLEKMKAKYNVILDETGELDIKQKDNDKLDVLDKGKKITFGQALRSMVLEDGVGTEIKEEDVKDDKKKKIIVGNEGGGSDDPIEIPDYIKSKMETEA